MVSDLKGPEAPTGARLVAALGLLEGMAQRGELKRAGSPEDMAMVDEVKKIQKEGPEDARSAAKRVLDAMK